MKKWKIAVLIVGLLLIAAWFWGPPVYEWLSVDLHGDMQWNTENDGALVYHGSVYYPTGWLEAVQQDTDVQLGWQYNFPFTSTASYYGNSASDPDYIYSVIGQGVFEVYWKDSGDIQDMVFCVDETDIEIVFSECFELSDVAVDDLERTENAYLELHGKEYPEITLHTYVFCCNDQWYTRQREQIWKLSEKFTEALSQSGLIE